MQREYPYIPNSAPDIKRQMLSEIGLQDEADLYAEIPEDLKFRGRLDLPDPIPDEHSLVRHVEGLLRRNRNCKEALSFLGAGCAPHMVPAVCDEIVGRAEFLTAYGAESYADHGKHQAFFEYQSLIAELVDQDFLTVPTYDGPNALAAALSMAGRLTGRGTVLLPGTINPQSYAVVRNHLASGQGKRGLKVQRLGWDRATGLMDLSDLRSRMSPDVAAVVVENPSYLGFVEVHAEEIGRIARAAGAEFIVYVDPISLGVMEAPANYHATMTVGDIHSLGLHLSAGSGHAGFVATPDEMRYFEETRDLVTGLADTTVAGELGYAQCLIERTHYAHRENAKEFTGTGTNLWAIAAAAYLSLMGPRGMEEIGVAIMKNAQYAAKRIAAIPGLALRLSSPFFQEFVVNYDGTGRTAREINVALLERDIFGGIELAGEFPDLGQSCLVCVTEVHSKEDIDRFAQALEDICSRAPGRGTDSPSRRRE